MLGFGAESIVHGLVCAMGLMALWSWRQRDAAHTRLACTAAALLLPALLTPALRVLAPARLTPAFRDGPALLSASHFLPWQSQGVTALYALAALGTLLFLRDLVPFVRDLFVDRPGQPMTEGPVLAAAQRVAQRLGVPAPPVLEVKHAGPVLMCRGWQPRLVVSAALVQALTPPELESAIAHEISHAARRDGRLGWGLMLVRALAFWNPAVQLLGRQAVREIEHRADQITVGLLGDGRSLASSLRRIGALQIAGDSWVHRMAHRHIEARCRALLNSVAPTRNAWPLAFALGLAVIMSLVVV